MNFIIINEIYILLLRIVNIIYNPMKALNSALFSISLFILVSSCKRLTLTDEKDDEQLDNTEKRRLVPLRIISEKLTLNFEYESGTGNLKKITSSDKSQIIITYKPKYYRIERFKDDVLYRYSDFLLTDGKALRIHRFDSSGNIDMPIGNCKLNYSKDALLTNIKDYNAANDLILERRILYAKSGVVSRIEQVDKQNNSTFLEYTYDDKNGIFKNVTHAQLFLLDLEYEFFSADTHNWLTYNNSQLPEENLTCSYSYNGDDYPSKMVINESGGKSTINITYVEIAK